MKQQTYISKFVNKKGVLVTFERWSDKKLSTVKGKLIRLYKAWYDVFKKDIANSEYIIIYETKDNTQEKEVDRISIKDFKKLLEV